MKKAILKVWYFFQGWLRYYTYYSKYKKCLIRPHIEEQIEVRINSMDRECFFNGSCKECGCSTTALQMANKACEGECYPSMLNKSSWIRLEIGFAILQKDTLWTLQKNSEGKLCFRSESKTHCYGRFQN